jgi:deoxyribodipyrimidine photolyase
MSGIFLFHRDLRTNDNLALNTLANNTKNIIPIFVFTPLF